MDTVTSPAQAAPATPLAASSGFDSKAFGETLVGSFKTHLAEVVKPLQDELAALKGKAAPATTAEAKALTAEDVTGLLDKHDKARAASDKAIAARDGYVAKELKGIPAAYTSQLAASDDPAVLSAAGEKIRMQYRADQEAAGHKVEDVAGANAGGPGGKAPAAMVDLSKLNPMQKIQLGITRAGQRGALQK